MRGAGARMSFAPSSHSGQEYRRVDDADACTFETGGEPWDAETLSFPVGMYFGPSLRCVREYGRSGSRFAPFSHSGQKYRRVGDEDAGFSLVDGRSWSGEGHEDIPPERSAPVGTVFELDPSCLRLFLRGSGGSSSSLADRSS